MTNPLEKLFKECQQNKRPPVHLWNPPHCGDIGLKIDESGVWWYQGSSIKREAMVRLFSTILRKEEDGSHVLVTPVEKIIIEVEDVPFIAVELEIEGSGEQQKIFIRTNVDDVITIDEEHPVTFETDPENEGLKPYINIRNGLQARLTRTMTYELLNHLEENELDGENVLGIWSSGQFFPVIASSQLT